jgi:hypothetical protein
MNEFRELSRLPEDQEYWDRLEARITADLAPAVHSLATQRPDWWAPVATRAWGLGGLAVAAGLAALLLVPARTLDAPSPTGLLRVPDGDPATIAFLSAPAPPPLAFLMFPSSRSDR